MDNGHITKTQMGTAAMAIYSDAAAALGRLGGKSTSRAKTRAARKNGKLGGRPKAKKKK